ncbi:helix-turn-helix transcriptional regulator [uncultured Akkermansia sp.]|uniref:helix-turn-helix domain-containing protein n=1 Tax=uncultured Akkermansia sp. TaxID=512294 RepID=UPI00263865A8|nr:helix-turn-helix transcriptional regulator [uncultured Akkermansia sp.]
MEDLRSDFKQWMKEHGKSREWVAGRLGMAKGTLNRWMSTTPIPEKKQKLLRELMEKEQQPKQVEISMDFTPEQLEMIRQAAALRGETPGEWCERAIKALTAVSVALNDYHRLGGKGG